MVTACVLALAVIAVLCIVCGLITMLDADSGLLARCMSYNAVCTWLNILFAIVPELWSKVTE